MSSGPTPELALRFHARPPGQRGERTQERQARRHRTKPSGRTLKEYIQKSSPRFMERRRAMMSSLLAPGHGRRSRTKSAARRRRRAVGVRGRGRGRDGAAADGRPVGRRRTLRHGRPVVSRRPAVTFVAAASLLLVTVRGGFGCAVADEADRGA
eukprot:357117-Chlamydomonas_euryale.AAC.5